MNICDVRIIDKETIWMSHIQVGYLAIILVDWHSPLPINGFLMFSSIIFFDYILIDLDDPLCNLFVAQAKFQDAITTMSATGER